MKKPNRIVALIQKSLIKLQCLHKKKHEYIFGLIQKAIIIIEYKLEYKYPN